MEKLKTWWASLNLVEKFGIAIGLPGLLWFYVFIPALEDPKPPPPQKTAASESANESGQARAAANFAVKKLLAEHLKTPSTAEYPYDQITTVKIPPIEGCTAFKTTGVVDSQNSFGATLRMKWQVVNVLKEGDWYPLCVICDGETLFGDPRYLR